VPCREMKVIWFWMRESIALSVLLALDARASKTVGASRVKDIALR